MAATKRNAMLHSRAEFFDLVRLTTGRAKMLAPFLPLTDGEIEGLYQDYLAREKREADGNPQSAER